MTVDEIGLLGALADAVRTDAVRVSVALLVIAGFVAAAARIGSGDADEEQALGREPRQREPQLRRSRLIDRRRS